MSNRDAIAQAIDMLQQQDMGRWSDAHDRVTLAALREYLAANIDAAPSAEGPEQLWLQLHGDCSDAELSEPVDYTGDDVTWCWHRINNSDVRYVRADLAGVDVPAEAQGENRG